MRQQDGSIYIAVCKIDRVPLIQLTHEALISTIFLEAQKNVLIAFTSQEKKMNF